MIISRRIKGIALDAMRNLILGQIFEIAPAYLQLLAIKRALSRISIATEARAMPYCIAAFLCAQDAMARKALPSKDRVIIFIMVNRENQLNRSFDLYCQSSIRVCPNALDSWLI
jgi:hypothetical protein